MQAANASSRAVLLASVFILHMVGSGFALQPIFTFMRTILTESQLPLISWLFPIGSFAAFVFGKSFGSWLLRNFPTSLIACHLVLATSYAVTFLKIIGLSRGAATGADLAEIGCLCLIIGCAHTLCWTLLVTAALRIQSARFHVFRAFGSSGWLIAGLSLTLIPSQSGLSLILGASLLLLIVIITTTQSRHLLIVDELTERNEGESPNHHSSKPTQYLFLVLLLVALVSTVEGRYFINAHSYLIKRIGDVANLYLMAPIAVEIVLLLAFAGRANQCEKRNAILIFAGPASWVLVTFSLAISCFWNAALVGLVFQSFNVLFHFAIALRLRKTVQHQSYAAAAIAVGSLSAHSMTAFDANLALSSEASWVWTGLLAVFAMLVALFYLTRKLEQHTAAPPSQIERAPE